MFILMVMLLSCKKEIPVTHVSGIVVNSGTNKPIDSVEVRIQDGMLSDNLSGGKTYTGSGAIQKYITSSDGKFEFNFKANNPYILASKKQYRFRNPNGAYEIYELLPGNTYNLSLQLDAYAFFNPVCKGVNCLISDTFILDLGNKIPKGYSKIATSFKYLGNGPHSSHAGEGLLARGDHFNYYWMKYQIHGMWHEKIDSVFIKSFTTYTDTIYY